MSLLRESLLRGNGIRLIHSLNVLELIYIKKIPCVGKRRISIWFLFDVLFKCLRSVRSTKYRVKMLYELCNSKCTESLLYFYIKHFLHFRYLHKKFKSQLSNIFSSFITVKNSPFTLKKRHKKRENAPIQYLWKIISELYEDINRPSVFSFFSKDTKSNANTQTRFAVPFLSSFHSGRIVICSLATVCSKSSLRNRFRHFQTRTHAWHRKETS